MGNLYHQLASEIISQINDGIYHVGDKLPGVRAMGMQRGVSPTTVVAAYEALAHGGYIESRPRSGFYVSARTHADFAVPAISQPVMMPKVVSGQDMVLKLVQQTLKAGVVSLGAAGPDFNVLPSAMIEKSLSKSARLERSNMCRYEFPPGNIELRRALAKRMARWGCNVSYEDIVITNGCQEAIFLSLTALTKPGDAVAVESPAYYGLLQILETLSLKAIEIPTDPSTGIAIDALQLAFDHWPIKACIVVSNFSNPLGATMSDDKKRALVALCKKQKVALIEDDIYGDVGFGSQRPSVCKRFDEKVIYCSSFSKSLAPGLRIG
ncbi:MAG: PLP-dependent aminotransferase family protein, partial [Moraxellaceae bacterium]